MFASLGISLCDSKFQKFFCVCLLLFGKSYSKATGLNLEKYTFFTSNYEVYVNIVLEVDTTKNSKTLNLSELISKIESSHPLVSAYRYESKLGKANLTASRGVFDPKFQVQTNEKNAQNQAYYKGEAFRLELPTASPFQFETGVESGRGTYINPEFFTPAGGLSYAGVSVPVLKGLITDSRRTTLAKAKVFRSQSLEIQKIQLLDLSQSILKDYIDWYIASEQERAYQTGVELSTERQEALRMLFEAGGCNGMDTLENHIQLELFQTLAKEWNVNTFKQRLQLSRHLWQYDTESKSWKPMVIAENVGPSLEGLEVLESLFKELNQSSIQIQKLPDLQNIEWDIAQKRLDLRLKKWDLLPSLDIKYQQLFSGVYQDYTLGQDQRFGLYVSAPLFMRKERGEYQMAKFQLEQKTNLFQFKLNETDLKIQALKQQATVYKDVYVQFKGIEKGFLDLFMMEREKFDSGDGTIFLLNTRENRYLSARIKTVEQFSKFQHSLIDYLREAGKISQLFFPLDGL